MQLLFIDTSNYQGQGSYAKIYERELELQQVFLKNL